MQITPDYKFVPFSLVDQDEAKSFKPNQIVQCTVKGTKKERSYRQLKMYFGCCNIVGENTSDPLWCDKDKTDFQCRVALGFFNHDRVAVIGKKVAFEVRSLSYDNCEHPDSCKYMDQAFELLASKIGVDIETLKRMYVEQSAS